MDTATDNVPPTSEHDSPTGRTKAWAVVTGASSGIGREFALALAERGKPVLAVARDGERLSALTDEIALRGGRVEPLSADLSRPDGVESVLAAAADREVELLVNNAGAASYGPFATLSPERERELLRLNVEAVVALTHGLLPAMLERGRGGVINLASIVAFQPMPYFATYAAGKAFVLSFSEALSEELRGSGVRVTVFAPGVTSTGFSDTAGSHYPERRFPHLEAQRVVKAALRAHEHRRTVKVVGAFYFLLTIADRFTPRSVVRRLMRYLWQPPHGTTTPPRNDAAPESSQPAVHEQP
jgi:short-subunit dehydrogenase